MKRGMPPTLLKARTGLFTPPGNTRWASLNSCSDLAVARLATRTSIMAALRQQLRRTFGVIGDDRIRSGPPHTGERFDDNLALVDPALPGGCLHHRVLTTDVVGKQGQLGPLPHRSN